MTLPVPNLDDRRFQDIVDEVKRLIPRHCPEWTDHNVSDPGVAMIELFAWMTELTLYRLNQVPDRLFTKFLELMGIQLFPPSAARAELLFRLTAPQPGTVTVPVGTQVGTVRTDRPEPLEFVTDEAVVARPAQLVGCQLIAAEGGVTDAWLALRTPHEEVTCFPTLTAGEAVCFGFDESLARNLVRLELSGVVGWVGVNPNRPPWRWEAWDGEGWIALPYVDDRTRAFQTEGAIELLLPAAHRPLTLGAIRAHWVRCRLEHWDDVARVEEPRSPRINRVTATTVGTSAPAHHGRPVPSERLGRSDGRPDQHFQVRHEPVLPRRAGETVRTITSVGSEDWVEVTDFSRSGPTDRHYRWDATGVISFGPFVRRADGSGVQHGAVPPADAEVTVTGYRVGGGSAGNLGPNQLTVLKTSIPFVASVDNPWPATGGVDPETVDNAKLRGPITLLTAQRAVTREDFEHLAHQASPDVARARCLPPQPADLQAPAGDAAPATPPPPGEEPWWAKQLEDGDSVPPRPIPVAPSPPTSVVGPIRVLIVPRRDVAPENLVLTDLVPEERLLRVVQRYLDDRRLVTSSIELSNIWFQGVQVTATVTPAPATTRELVRERALAALYRYINPLVGGPEGRGWPFDRPLTLGDVHVLLAGVEGVELVDEVTVVPVRHMGRGELGEPVQRIPLPPDALFASFRHEVMTP